MSEDIGELILVTSENCPHCREFKKALEEAEIQFRELMIEEVPPEKEGDVMKLINELNIYAVPTLIVKRDKEYCVLEEKGGKLAPGECKKLDVDV